MSPHAGLPRPVANKPRNPKRTIDCNPFLRCAFASFGSIADYTFPGFLSALYLTASVQTLKCNMANVVSLVSIFHSSTLHVFWSLQILIRG
ncbi:hypothetical protein B0H11DRAFT_1985472 [Mycena galericulata]|nr:hypothetical protein B0H11DRAFT_1985472 [Mycena galericulata]